MITKHGWCSLNFLSCVTNFCWNTYSDVLRQYDIIKNIGIFLMVVFLMYLELTMDSISRLVKLLPCTPLAASFSMEKQKHAVLCTP